MELVKQKLTQMKDDHEASEERILKFQSELVDSKRNLEAALHEKESLARKIEAVEAQIINANKQGQFLLEQLRSLERNTDENEGRRRFLQDRELEGEQSLSQLEYRLDEVRDKFVENSTKCENAERRLVVLKAEYEKIRSKRLEMEDQSLYLQKEVDEKTLQLRDLEETELKTSARDFRNEDHIRLVEDYYSDAVEREEHGRLNCQRLQRLIEQVEDQIELVQRRKKKTEVELKNTVQAVINN